MKRHLSLLLVLAVLLPALAGCQNTAPAETNAKATTENATQPTIAGLPASASVAPAETNPATQPDASQAPRLTRQEAINIALKDAGFPSDQVRELEAELDRDAGVLHYDVDFDKDGYDYDYEIDAVSGKILKVEKGRD